MGRVRWLLWAWDQLAKERETSRTAVHRRSHLSTSHDRILDKACLDKQKTDHPSAVLVTSNWRTIWSGVGRTVKQWPNHLSRYAAAGAGAARSARTGRGTPLSSSYLLG